MMSRQQILADELEKLRVGIPWIDNLKVADDTGMMIGEEVVIDPLIEMKAMLIPEQTEAVNKILEFAREPGTGEMLLEGPAGSGKTLCAAVVIRTLEAERPNSVLITAPTNKAARILREALRGMRTMTTHSALGLVLKPKADKQKLYHLKNAEYSHPSTRLMVVDEASMISRELRGHIDPFLDRHNMKVLYLGDFCQLPPVVAEKRKKELSWVFSEIPRKVALERVMRHGGAILDTSSGVREMILKGNKVRCMITRDDVTAYKNSGDFEENLTEVLQKADGSVVRVLAWRNVAVKAYNEIARRILYGDEASDPFLPGEPVVAGEPLRVKKILQMSNNEEGTVDTVDLVMIESHGVHVPCRKIVVIPNERSWVKVVAFVPTEIGKQLVQSKLDQLRQAGLADPGKWHRFWAFKEKFHDLRTCHAMTIHKSQGSTFDHVFVDVVDVSLCRSGSDSLRLLYVAVSRASESLTIRIG